MTTNTPMSTAPESGAKFIKMMFSQREWNHLQERIEKNNRGSFHSFLNQEIRKFQLRYMAASKNCQRRDRQQKNNARKRESKVRYSFQMPPELVTFYDDLSAEFGIEMATFVLRFVLLPHLVCHPEDNILKGMITEEQQQ